MPEDSEDDGRPFAHESLALLIWLVFTMTIIIGIDPAGTTWWLALGSFIVGGIGGFIGTAILFAAFRLYMQKVLGVDPWTDTPTALGYYGPMVAILVLTAVLFGPMRAVVESVSTGQLGDHPFRKGIQGTLLLTGGVATMVAEPLVLSLLSAFGIQITEDQSDEQGGTSE